MKHFKTAAKADILVSFDNDMPVEMGFSKGNPDTYLVISGEYLKRERPFGKGKNVGWVDGALLHEMKHFIQTKEKRHVDNVIQPSAQVTVALLMELEAYKFLDDMANVPFSVDEWIKNKFKRYEGNFQISSWAYHHPRNPDEIYEIYADKLGISFETIKGWEAQFRQKYPDHEVRTEGDTTYYEGVDRTVVVKKTPEGTELDYINKDFVSILKGKVAKVHLVFDPKGNLKTNEIVCVDFIQFTEYKSDFEWNSVTVVKNDGVIERLSMCEGGQECVYERWDEGQYTTLLKDRSWNIILPDKKDFTLADGRKFSIQYDQAGKIIIPPEPEVGKRTVAKQPSAPNPQQQNTSGK